MTEIKPAFGPHNTNPQVPSQRINVTWQIEHHCYLIEFADGSRKHYPKPFVLCDVVFVVDKAERIRRAQLADGSRNVHAYALGWVVPQATGVLEERGRITYDPRQGEAFVVDFIAPIHTAELVLFDLEATQDPARPYRPRVILGGVAPLYQPWLVLQDARWLSQG